MANESEEVLRKLVKSATEHADHAQRYADAMAERMQRMKVEIIELKAEIQRLAARKDA